MTHTSHRVSPLSLTLLFLLCFFLLLSGCATQQTSSSRQTRDGRFAFDAPDTMEEEYVPIDDGLPLTEAELAAFNSTGELDTNLSQEEKQLVELFFKSYVHNYRKTVERFLARSEIYMPFVQKVFRERGLPVELSCLAFVESGFNPNAVSRAGAGGMWQFMPYTGKKYGLYQDSWIDERRDPYKATHAAADYLTKLHEYFDKDWHLAIAAYNAGEGKIGRALAATDSKTFFEICRKNGMLDYKAQLREETQQYLPRFLAFTKIMRNLETLGFVRPDPRNAPQLTDVSVPGGVDLRRFSREINMDWEQFRGFNPAYMRSISPPTRQSTAWVPQSKETLAQSWLSQKSIAVYANWRNYQVKRGDTMARIAQRTGSSTALLREANGKPSNTLQVGEYILVPASARAARDTMARMSLEAGPVIAGDKKRPARNATAGTHTIAPGDTLYGLALGWGVTVDDICLLNNLDPSDSLRTGRKITIPANGTSTLAEPEKKSPEAVPVTGMAAQTRTSAPLGFTVTVGQGETLFNLARTHGVSVEELCKANAITPKTPLFAGRKLLIPAGAHTAAILTPAGTAKKTRSQEGKTEQRAASAAKSKSAVIQSGDTLYSLARAHGTSVDAIARHNGLKPDAPLKLGQVIYIP